MFNLNSLTEEQQAVAHLICDERANVVVNAVAGSGKTRTALTTACTWLEKTNRAMPVLLIAYNKRLEQDMSAQKEKNVPNALRGYIEIRTIHGLGHRYFEGIGMTTDKEIDMWTRNRTPPARTLPQFGLVIVDEAQDLTDILFSFIHYVISLLPTRPQLLILGDPFQMVYGYNGAKVSYLTNAKSHFGDVVKAAPFEHMRLSICFRISHEMAAWINTHLNPNNLRDAIQNPGWFEENQDMIATWWADGIRANPKRPPEHDSLRFFRRSIYSKKNGGRGMLIPTENAIREVLERHDVDATAVLAPSITNSQFSPGRLITNWFGQLAGEPCAWYVDAGDTNADGEYDVRRNKRLSSTIHRYKGRECDGVVLLGLDAYGERQSKKDPLSLFNVLYVGATRARKQLLIIEWSEISYCTVRLPNNREMPKEIQPESTTVPQLLRHCPYNQVLCDESPVCLTSDKSHSIPAIPFQPKDYIVPGAHHGTQRSTLEDVSTILSAGIRVRLQLLLDHGVLDFPSLDEIPESERKNVPPNLRMYVRQLRRDATRKREYAWFEVLRIALARETIDNLHFFRWRQTKITPQWPMVRDPMKLDLAVENLVHLLYEAFCNLDSKGSFSQQQYAHKLTALRALRRENRLITNQIVMFDMPNPEFNSRYGTLVGVIDVALISPMEAKRRAEQTETRSCKSQKTTSNSCPGQEIIIFDSDASSADEDNHEDDSKVEESEPVSIVRVKVGSTLDEDDRLSIACEGSLYELSTSLDKSALASCSEGRKVLTNAKNASKPPTSPTSNAKSKRPKLFVACATEGLLVTVNQHMEALEFIHRLCSRKLSIPFDKEKLSKISPGPVQTAENVDIISITSSPDRETIPIDVDEYWEKQKAKHAFKSLSQRRL